MRILLVTSQTIPHVGGLSTHFQLLERSLRQNGMLAGVVTGRDIVPGFARYTSLCVSRFAGRDVARKRILESCLERLSEILRHTLQGRDSPGLIHCHDPLASAAAHFALRGAAASIPVVQTVHGPWSREALMGGAAPNGNQVTYIRGLEETAFATASHLIPVDHGQADILSDAFCVTSAKMTVISNGIDTASIARWSEAQLRVPIRQPYFVVPRRLVKKNGVEVALKALARLPSQAVLAISGDGPLRLQLERSADALGISHRVLFLGNLPPETLLPLMRGALGVLIPSVPADGVVEATSLAALEGMACGTPILVSDIGGLREIVSRAGIGFLFPPGDDVALASAMRELEAMPKDEMSALRSRTLQAASAFDVRPWFDAIRAVYVDALASAPSRTTLVQTPVCQ
ncbi:MAG TPA: glycosyltransferase family 4 protein [Bryobacteraceae bacterium]|nr:glycosyltransferase family 4 protein [Bryobacteraceae bacterium]